MPNVNPNAPTIAPGVATPSDGYPQYGVGGGTPGQAAGWKTVTAHNAQQKDKLTGQGYFVWFSSKGAADNFVSSQSSAFGSGSGGPFAGVADIAAALAKIGAAVAWFFDEIANVHLWASVMWILAGTIALFVGVYLWLRTQGIEPPLPIPIPI